MTSFNLAHDRWLPALAADGNYADISLIEAFTASQSVTIAAGGGLVDSAIHRLLLAITYAALGSPIAESYPTPADDIPTITQWLTEHADHFELLDSTTPFAQDYSLTATDAPVLPPSILNPMLARDRAKITDWRTLDDEPTMSFADAARWLIVQLAYSVGGRHKGISTSLPESPLTGLITYRPAGTLAETLAWARIPVDVLGEANWTWHPRADEPGTRGARPTGELDALTWLSRRYRLHHDGTHIIGLQQSEGWRRAPEINPDAPIDSGHGRHDLAVAASSATKPAKAAAINGRTWRAAAGDPVELTASWERGGPASLAHHVRSAVITRGLPAPTIVATGHQVESKVLWQGQATTVLPLIDRDVAARAALISKARFAARTFGNTLDADLLTASLPTSDKDALGELTERLLPTRRPAQGTDLWPTNTDSVFPARSTLDLDLDGIPEVVAEQIRAQHRAVARSDEIGRLFVQLRRDVTENDGNRARPLAHRTRTTIPAVEDIAALDYITDFNLDDPALRLWTGLAAIWLTTHPRRGANDTPTPLPIAVRRASATIKTSRGREIIHAITNTSCTPHALRVHLIDALDLVAATGHALSWRSLHHDLTNWNDQTATHWKDAYWTGAPTTNTSTTPVN